MTEQFFLVTYCAGYWFDPREVNAPCAPLGYIWVRPDTHTHTWAIPGNRLVCNRSSWETMVERRVGRREKVINKGRIWERRIEDRNGEINTERENKKKHGDRDKNKKRNREWKKGQRKFNTKESAQRTLAKMLFGTPRSASRSLARLEVFPDHTYTVCYSCDGHHTSTSGKAAPASLMRRMPRENVLLTPYLFRHAIPRFVSTPNPV